MRRTLSVAFVAAAIALTTLFACVNSLEAPTKGASLSVDPSLCSGCRKCIAVCNADAITIIGNKAVIDLTKCIKCFKCLDACPTDAIY